MDSANPAESIVYGDVPNHVLRAFQMRFVDDPDFGPSVEMELRPETANGFGGMQGGVLAALIEVGSAGVAARECGSVNIVAADLNIRYLAPLKVGPARLSGHAMRVGRRSVIVQVDVRDVGAGGRIAASATVGYARLDG